MILTSCFILMAYLFGSLSSAIILCKLLNLPDPRTHGSKNPGATNVLRIAGKKTAALVLLGDVLKGVIPVVLARVGHLEDQALSLVALAAFIGHLYPIFFRFEGGKGVATFLGTLVALAWPIGLLVIATWLVVALLSRYSSLASLVAAISAPLYCWWLSNPNYLVALFIMVVFLLVRHRANIKRLIAGTESRLGQKSV